jgi:hypothetical protein
MPLALLLFFYRRKLMNRKWKLAIIAALALLLAGTLAFTQTGNSPKTEEQAAPFSLDKNVWCGGPRSNYGEDYSGPDNGGGYGNGGGFDCH